MVPNGTQDIKGRRKAKGVTERLYVYAFDFYCGGLILAASPDIML